MPPTLTNAILLNQGCMLRVTPMLALANPRALRKILAVRGNSKTGPDRICFPYILESPVFSWKGIIVSHLLRNRFSTFLFVVRGRRFEFLANPGRTCAAFAHF